MQHPININKLEHYSDKNTSEILIAPKLTTSDAIHYLAAALTE